MAHKHLSLNPETLHLSEIPKEGKTFTYSHESGELTGHLKDLIGTKPYKVEITVQPMGNVYTATGRIEAGIDELCSLCAMEFIHPVQESFHEILVIQEPDPRGHQAKVNHSSELNTDGPECTELESEEFSVGEFVHQMIALARPIKPLGKSDCNEKCENYQDAVRKGWLTPYNNEGFSKSSPFAELSKIKLNS